MRPALLSRLLLPLARVAPRGGFRLVRWLAARDPALRSYPVRLELLPGRCVLADLRESICYPLWRYGCYPWQLAEDRLSLRFLRPGDTVWDIGANIGYTALLYAHAVGAQGHVLAVEPGRRSFAILERTLADVARVAALQAAISDAPGSVWFADAELLDRASIQPSGEGAYRVDAVTLDELEVRHAPAPDFIKIDVEGHEPAVLRGGKRLISSRLPLIEFEALDATARRSCIAVLQDLGGGRYRFYRILHDGSLAPAEAAPEHASTSNYVALTESHRPRFEGVRLDD